MRASAGPDPDGRPSEGPPGDRPRPGRAPAHTTAGDALEGARTAIAAAGCETPRLDAELIVAHVLGVSRERLVSDPAMAVPGDRVRQLQDAVRRRAVAREPVAYIIGRRAFRRLELRVDPRVLVPRPETESLVEAAIELLPRGARVLDVGTGSGAIALALRDERPDLSVSGGDVSEAALEVARANGELLGLDVRWVHCDLLQGAPADLDAVVANLPYVATGERTRLAPEIVRHEPPAALFAGGDGLATIRALCNQLGERPLVRRALLEVGEGQAAAVGALLQEAGFFDVAVRRDLAGIERILAATRRT